MRKYSKIYLQNYKSLGAGNVGNLVARYFYDVKIEVDDGQ